MTKVGINKGVRVSLSNPDYSSEPAFDIPIAIGTV
jgi:hypothetical protein